MKAHVLPLFWQFVRRTGTSGTTTVALRSSEISVDPDRLLSLVYKASDHINCGSDDIRACILCHCVLMTLDNPNTKNSLEFSAASCLQTTKMKVPVSEGHNPKFFK
jgi:hypothetical protein